MPATSEKQRRFMMAEKGRKQAGKKTRTGMSMDQLEDFKHMKKMPKAHSMMPKGGKQKGNWGDVGALRQAEAKRVVPAKGQTVSASSAMPIRTMQLPK